MASQFHFTSPCHAIASTRKNESQRSTQLQQQLHHPTLSHGVSLYSLLFLCVVYIFTTNYQPTNKPLSLPLYHEITVILLIFGNSRRYLVLLVTIPSSYLALLSCCRVVTCAVRTDDGRRR